MSGQEILVSIMLGLVVNELCDVSPWCARQLVRLSVRLRYTNLERRRVRADELVALIAERPGKLFKLGTALGFLTASVPTWIYRVVPNALHRLARPWTTPRGTPRPAGTARMTITNRSSLPVAAVEIGTTLSALDTGGGLVTVNGTWGSGKTTIVHAALTALDGTPTVTYNPWLWSGGPTRHAMGGLPENVRAASSDLTRFATALDRYLSVSHSGQAEHWPRTLGERWARRRLARSSRAVPRPVVIVLDDIDRLPPQQARQVFEIVARTAGLPQLGYLMSFDRSVVEPLLPPGLLDKCIGKLQVELAWGTCRQRLA